MRAITGLSRSLHMCTTAEGVETEGQLAQLRDLGCIEMQGHLFSAAIPARAYALHDRNSEPSSRHLNAPNFRLQPTRPEVTFLAEKEGSLTA